MAIGMGQKSYPFNYNTIVSFVPRQAGVYVLFGSHCLYVGESQDLADGLLQFLLGPEQTIHGEPPATFQFEVVSSEDERKARRKQLSRDCQVPPRNK